MKDRFTVQEDVVHVERVFEFEVLADALEVSRCGGLDAVWHGKNHSVAPKSYISSSLITERCYQVADTHL